VARNSVCVEAIKERTTAVICQRGNKPPARTHRAKRRHALIMTGLWSASERFIYSGCVHQIPLKGLRFRRLMMRPQSDCSCLILLIPTTPKFNGEFDRCPNRNAVISCEEEVRPFRGISSDEIRKLAPAASVSVGASGRRFGGAARLIAAKASSIQTSSRYRPGQRHGRCAP
jgi:hypothetical protein